MRAVPDPSRASAAGDRRRLRALSSTQGPWAYGLALATVVLCTAVAWTVSPYFRPANLIMVYLAGIVALATQVGRGPSILGASLSVLAFDVLFTPPPFMISLRDTEYVVGFAVMVALAVLISDRSEHIRRQARMAQSLLEEAQQAKIRSRRSGCATPAQRGISRPAHPAGRHQGAATTLIGTGFADPGTRLS